MKRLIGAVSVILLVSTCIFAKGDYGTPGEFLNWGAGARSMGMGKAFTGLADDASAIYYNPAGLAFQNPLQITAQHVFLFYDTMYDFAAITYPISGIGTFGLGYVRLGSTGFDARSEIWEPIGPDSGFDVVNQAVLISYAREIMPWMGMGMNLKIINQAVFELSGTGFGIDAGFLFTPSEYISFGLSAINALPPNIKLDQTAETYPIIIKFGLALKLLGERVIPVFDVEQELSGKDLKFRAGLELVPFDIVALRAGLDETELAFGLGLSYKPYKVDYSVAFQELGMAHRMSFTLAFGGFDINLSADPKLFSPVGTRRNTTISIYAVTKYEILDWEINVMNEDGDVVRYYTGDGAPPASVIWDGKDDRGLPVSDGEYRFVMKVLDKNRRTIESGRETVKISTTVPMQPGAIELRE